MQELSFATKTIEQVTETLIDYRGKTPEKTASGIKLLTAKVIKGGRIVDGNHEYISENSYDAWMRRGLPKQGDILITTEAPLGEVAQLRSPEKIALAQRVILLRGDPKEVDQDYYLQALKSPFTQGELARRSSGAIVLGIKQSELRHVRIPHYPLPTQRKIAAVLSAYDDLIENNVRRIAILEEMAAALYREWFIELRFPGHASVPIAESEQGRVPQGWKIKTLGDLATDERRAANPAQVDADTPYIGLEHIPRKSIALSEWGRAADVSSAKLFFNQGEILFGKIRPYFHKVAVAPVSGVCSTDAIVIVPRAAELFALVLCCASSEEFVAHAVQTSQGTKMPRANWGVMSRFPVVVPPVPLMQRFNAAVNEMVEQIQKLTAVNANLRATRDLLLPKLVAGEVDVSQLAIAGATDETDETTNGAEDADS